MQSIVTKTVLKGKVGIPTVAVIEVQPPPRKLLDRVHDAIRVKHYSYQTGKSYLQWIRRYILFTTSVTLARWMEMKSMPS
jgi:hypothetical protein